MGISLEHRRTSSLSLKTISLASSELLFLLRTRPKSKGNLSDQQSLHPIGPAIRDPVPSLRHISQDMYSQSLLTLSLCLESCHFTLHSRQAIIALSSTSYLLHQFGSSPASPSLEHTQIRSFGVVPSRLQFRKGSSLPLCRTAGLTL